MPGNPRPAKSCPSTRSRPVPCRSSTMLKNCSVLKTRKGTQVGFAGYRRVCPKSRQKLRILSTLVEMPEDGFNLVTSKSIDARIIAIWG